MLHVSRNTNQRFFASEWSDTDTSVQVKYLGVVFTSDGRQNKELGIPIGKAIAIMKALHYLVIIRRFSRCETKIVKIETKLSIFETVFVFSHQSWAFKKHIVKRKRKFRNQNLSSLKRKFRNQNYLRSKRKRKFCNQNFLRLKRRRKVRNQNFFSLKRKRKFCHQKF